jgi:hypothetical protein
MIESDRVRYDIGAGMHKLSVQLRDLFRVLEDHFGHERASLNIAAVFQFEEIAFGTDNRAVFESLEKSGRAWVSC